VCEPTPRYTDVVVVVAAVVSQPTPRYNQVAVVCEPTPRFIDPVLLIPRLFLPVVAYPNRSLSHQQVFTDCSSVRHVVPGEQSLNLQVLRFRTHRPFVPPLQGPFCQFQF